MIETQPTTIGNKIMSMLTATGIARQHYAETIEPAPSRFSADFKAWTERADNYAKPIKRIKHADIFTSRLHNGAIECSAIVGGNRSGYRESQVYYDYTIKEARRLFYNYVNSADYKIIV